MATEAIIWDASATATVTIASLGNGSARQMTAVDNTTNDRRFVRFYAKITVGTTPTANTTIEFYPIRANGASSPTYRDDNAGASDAAITITNTDPIATILVPVNTSNVAYYKSFLVEFPGDEIGLAIKNNTGVALNSTAGNHFLYYQTGYTTIT